MKENAINIANDFSRFPAGRYESDGPFNGEKFRRKILVPSLQDGKSIIVELDGTAGYGSSFLEEAFGGLIRVEHLRPDVVIKQIHLKSADASLVEEIKGYILSAK